MPYVAVGCRTRRKLYRVSQQLHFSVAAAILSGLLSPVGRLTQRASFTADALIQLAAYATVDKKVTQQRLARFNTDPDRFDVSYLDWSPHSFKGTFRFRQADFPRVVAALRIPAVVQLPVARSVQTSTT